MNSHSDDLRKVRARRKTRKNILSFYKIIQKVKNTHTFVENHSVHASIELFLFISKCTWALLSLSHSCYCGGSDFII